MAQSPSDYVELLRQLAKGDEASFHLLYERYQGPVFRFVWYMSGNQTTALRVEFLCGCKVSLRAKSRSLHQLLLQDSIGSNAEVGHDGNYFHFSWMFLSCFCASETHEKRLRH